MQSSPLEFDEMNGAIGFANLLPMPSISAMAEGGGVDNTAAASSPTSPTSSTTKVTAPPKTAGSAPRDDTGPLPELVSNTNFAVTDGKYYVTTAISYTNGLPHIGHAYESLSADVLARWNRIYGRKVFSMTGTDEHGQKIANAAEAQGVKPIDICDKYSAEFVKLNRRMLVSNDRFMRTTEPHHYATCQDMWRRCAAKGDIYLDSYKGWYLEREETFVTPKDAEVWGFKDPDTGVPLKEVEEESYFFRLSKYADALKAFYSAHPEACQPEDRRAQILAQLEDLQDLSISRTSFKWGIPVPPEFDQRHVMYVWFDALTNYLSGVHGNDPAHPLNEFWPASAHIIGKDIIRFHSVYWPAMLMSAGLPVSLSVFSHGFINASDGRKMSKSFGNVIDPHDMLDKYPSDTLRFFLTSEAPFGGDVKFSEEALVRLHNGPLADTLGNLVHRSTNLCEKYCAGKVPTVGSGFQELVTTDPPIDVAALKEQLDVLYASFDLLGARDLSMEATRKCNNWLARLEPWKMKLSEQEELRTAVVRVTLECVFVLAHFFSPLLPVAATEMLRRVTGDGPKAAVPVGSGLFKCNFNNLAVGSPVTVGDPLFPKLADPSADTEVLQTGTDTGTGSTSLAAGTGAGGKKMSANALAAAAGKAAKDAKKLELKAKQAAQKLEKEKTAAAAAKGEAAAAPVAAAPVKGEGGGQQQQQEGGGEGSNQPKVEKKKNNNKKAGVVAAAAASEAEVVEECCKLDFRVGVITKAWEHPDSEKLWVEEVDCGEASGPRTICSGLRAFYPTAEEVCPIGGRPVVIVANLKTKKLGGLPSQGMVLCASSPAHDVVKFVDPPKGAKPGDRVTFQGLPVIEPATPAQIAKKKVDQNVIFGGQLTTALVDDGSGGTAGGAAVCTFKGLNAMVVEGVGTCTAPVPAGYTVS